MSLSLYLSLLLFAWRPFDDVLQTILNSGECCVRCVRSHSRQRSDRIDDAIEEVICK